MGKVKGKGEKPLWSIWKGDKGKTKREKSHFRASEKATFRNFFNNGEGKSKGKGSF